MPGSAKLGESQGGELAGSVPHPLELGAVPGVLVVIGSEIHLDALNGQLALVLHTVGGVLSGSSLALGEPVHKRMVGPAVVGVEGVGHQSGFLGLGQHEQVGTDLPERCHGVIPEVHRHLVGHIAAEAVDTSQRKPSTPTSDTQ